MTLRLRSLLFMPADSPRKIAKGAALPADAIIADLEDAVAPSRKQEARSLLVESFQILPEEAPLRCIRINPVHSPLWPADLLETFAAAPRGLCYPQGRVRGRPATRERAAGATGKRGGVAHRNCAAAGNRRERRRRDESARDRRRRPQDRGLGVRRRGFAGDIGAQRTREGWEVFYARSAVVTAAAAFGLQAVDTVYTDLADDTGPGRRV